MFSIGTIVLPHQQSLSSHLRFSSNTAWFDQSTQQRDTESMLTWQKAYGALKAYITVGLAHANSDFKAARHSFLDLVQAFVGAQTAVWPKMYSGFTPNYEGSNVDIDDGRYDEDET